MTVAGPRRLDNLSGRCVQTVVAGRRKRVRPRATSVAPALLLTSGMTTDARPPKLRSPAPTLVVLATVGIAGCGEPDDTQAEIVNAVTGVTVIDFENLAAGTAVTTQYAGQAVLMNGLPTVITWGSTQPLPHVLSSTVAPIELDTDPLAITLTSAQARVKLFAGIGSGCGPVTGTLTGYNAAGGVVAADGPRSVATGALTTSFEVKNPTAATITKVTLEYFNCYGAPKIIDNLELEGQPPPPLPTTAPTVRITAPANRTELTASPVQVQGTVTGDQVVSGELIVNRLVPPGSNRLTQLHYPMSLFGSGTSRTFSQSQDLGAGSLWITASATNTAGLKGLATILVDNLTVPMRVQLGENGGATSLGNFEWGSEPTTSAPCAYAVYAQGAVADLNGVAHVIGGNIFAKWLARKDGGGYPNLGCPTTDQRVVLTASDGTAIAWAQDFEHGRIYDWAITGTHYVPPLFAQALDILGQDAIGLPYEEPTSNLDPVHGDTYQLQRFVTSTRAMLTTLEIRGNPIQLWVERQGGDGSRYYPGTELQGIDRHTPTLVDAFPCDTSSGPCHIVRPSDDARFSADDAAARCSNGTIGPIDLVLTAVDLPPTQHEWAAIEGDRVQTPLFGVVAKFEHSHEDLPTSHEYMDTPCDWEGVLGARNRIIGEVALGQWPVALIEAAALLAEWAATGDFCPSDYDINVRPLFGFGYRMVPGVDSMSLEIESHFLDQAPAYMQPQAGDALFTTGRFIVDCGHSDPYRTEIHPPSVMAVMRTIDDTESTLPNHTPYTLTSVWVNSFYSGTAVQLDIYPPPRPSATAVLHLVQPVGGGINVTATTDDPSSTVNHVHVTITGQSNTVEITSIGEMKWPGNIPWFTGQWQVYWGS